MQAQVELIVDSANPIQNDNFEIDVSVNGFDSISSAQFRLRWDTTVIQLLSFTVPVDTVSANSPFNANADEDWITFFFLDGDDTGINSSISDGNKLLKLTFKAVGSPGSSTCIEIDNSRAVEFIKLALEELSTSVQKGTVLLQGTNSTSSLEQTKINCYWNSPSSITIDHPPLSVPANLKLYTSSGQLLRSIHIPPNTTSTESNLQNTYGAIVASFSYGQYSFSRLIPSPF